MNPPDTNPARISLIVPVYNESESLRPLFDEIVTATKTLALQVEILFVDDGSRDDSWKQILSLAAESTSVRGIRFRKNFGKAAALAAGFRAATGQIVLTLDADLQDDPKEIPRFLDAIAAGADVVSGWKKIRHDPWHKVFPSRVFNAMVSWLTGVKLHDHNCGFKAYRAEVTRNVRLYGELHRFVPVLAAAEGYRVGELIIHHRARKFGYSKFGARRFLKGFLDLLAVSFRTTFGQRPMHAFGTFAVLGFAGAGFCLCLALFTSSWFLAPLVWGLAFVMIVLSGQAILTGLLAELFLARAPTLEPFQVVAVTPPLPPTA